MKINNEKIARKIESEFDKLPNSISTKILYGFAEGCLDRARKREEEWKDSLFFAGVSLVHAKLHAGILSNAIELNDCGWYVPSVQKWGKRSFAQIAIPSYIEGFKQANLTIPKSIQQIVMDIYPKWFALKFNNLKYSPGMREFILNPKPAVLPFDHFSENRKFIGDAVHYPAFYVRRVFNYMKGWDFPPTMWYSNRFENDFEYGVLNKTKMTGITPEEAMRETGKHEATHVLAINPLIKLTMTGSAHCWLSEGVAQYFGDGKKTQISRFANTKVKSLKDIVDTEGKPIDYGASLLLTLAIAVKFGGSMKKITSGMVEIVKLLSKKAELISNDQSDKLNSPLELLYFLDPSLHKNKKKKEVINIMSKIRKEYT